MLNNVVSHVYKNRAIAATAGRSGPVAVFRDRARKSYARLPAHIIESIVVDLCRAGANISGFALIGEVDTIVTSGSVRRVGAIPHIVDKVVVDFDLPLGRIDAGEVNPIAFVVVDQIVVDGYVILLVPSGIACPSRPQRGRVHNKLSTSVIIVVAIPSSFDVVGIRGEVNRVVLA